MEFGKIIVVSAPSGGGKTTLLDHVRATVPGLHYSVSATTRPPRSHEIDGVHYFFLSKEEFNRRIEANGFAEWQQVHGNYYGTPRHYIDEIIAGKEHIIMDIDVYGKKKFDLVYPQAIGIMILPPSFEVLEQRLRSRATDAEEVIQTRLNNAREELRFGCEQGKYEHSIVNDNLEDAKRSLVALIQKIIAS